MGELKAIPTYYNGYHFRSRLEARWAVFFDSLGIKYEYEPEGFDLGDGLYYLPDFYLPQSKQFFEVKGILEELDAEKIRRFIKGGNCLTIGKANGAFLACDLWKDGFSLVDGGASWLCKCKKCGKYWFMGCDGSYKCQCCGEYAGDGHFDLVMDYYESPGQNGVVFEVGNLSAWDVAKQARFEHGETPQIRRACI